MAKVPALSFMQTIAVNVDNPNLGDADFRRVLCRGGVQHIAIPVVLRARGQISTQRGAHAYVCLSQSTRVHTNADDACPQATQPKHRSREPAPRREFVTKG